MNRSVKLLIVVWSFIMMLVTLFLLREYYYLVEQSHKLITLKREYENHLMAVSRILYEYNVLQEHSKYREPMGSKKKTKQINSTYQISFPPVHTLSPVPM